MARAELEIEIDPTGKVTMRTKGIKGPACMQWADLLVQIVGQEESRQKTNEFYETAHEHVVPTVDVKQQRS